MTPALPALDEKALDKAVAAMRAPYPVRVFPSLDDEQRDEINDLLHKHGYSLDRISAQVVRVMAQSLAIEAITTYLAALPPAPSASEPTAKELHLMDLYDSLGVEWGSDPFPVIAALRAPVPPAQSAVSVLGEPCEHIEFGSTARCGQCPACVSALRTAPPAVVPEVTEGDAEWCRLMIASAGLVPDLEHEAENLTRILAAVEYVHSLRTAPTEQGEDK